MALDVGERAPLAAATLQRLGFPPNRAMYRAGVHAEGTCFYHSLAYALNDHDYHQHSDESKRSIGHNLRRRVQRALQRTSIEAWRAFWAERGVNDPPPVRQIRKEIGEVSTWADIWAIEFSMSVLNTNILFFNLSIPEMYCGVGDWRYPTTVLVAWVDGAHFEPIVEEREAGARAISHFATDDPLIRHVKRGFGRACQNVTLRDVVART